MNPSVNRLGVKLAKKVIEQADQLGVMVEIAANGATLIDAGIEAPGGLEAGRYLTEICMGGLGHASIRMEQYGDLQLPSIFVATDHPAASLLGSQIAGWQISVGKYFAIGSGPARALALKPRELYEKISYRDNAEEGVIVLETSQKPSEEALNFIAKECGLDPKRLYVAVAPTSSIAGCTQISGRSAETALHKLAEIGFDPKTIVSASGVAPIAPVHPSFTVAMGKTNDMILYGATVFLSVRCDDEKYLEDIVKKTPSSVSPSYGKPFLEIFKEAGQDFYKIDPNLFAPARIVVNNLRTGRCFHAGQLNTELIKRQFA